MSNGQSDGQQFEYVELAPAGREFLACSCAYPKEWVRVELPPEEPNVQEDMTAFLPLMITMAGYGAVLFTVGARPAFGDGTVLDWAKYLAQANGLEILSARAVKVGDLPAVQVEAIQPSEMGRMRTRVIFLEDGGRLYNLGNMAPEQVWPSVDALLHSCLNTFRLKEVRGPGAALGIEFAEDKIEHPKPSLKPLTSSQGKSAEGAKTQACPVGKPPTAAEPENKATLPADVAVAEDAAALDPEHPTNANLRNNGVGFTTPIFKINAAEKYALVGSSTLQRALKVPFGWHAIDDTRRTLVFETGRNIQINLDLRQGQAGDIPALFQSIVQDLYQTHGDFEYFEFDAGEFKGLGAKNLKIDGQLLGQAYLAKPSDHPERLLVCRVTAAGEHLPFGLNAAEVLVTSLQPLPTRRESVGGETKAEQPKREEPAWWVKAKELEQQDKLKEAEETILEALNHLGAYSQVAELYEQRGNRLKAANKPREAHEAYEKSCKWMETMAAGATSGGEGAALSLQAKEHRQRLGL